jgi:hypothetical protein
MLATLTSFFYGLTEAEWLPGYSANGPPPT